MNNQERSNLIEEHELAYFRADVCLASPQSFSLEEKRQICEQMEASTAEIDAAIKTDFETLSPEAQTRLLGLLCESGCMTPEWWRATLFGKMPESPTEIAGAVHTYVHRPVNRQYIASPRIAGPGG